MVRQGTAQTLSSHFYELIRRDIVNGVLHPGDRLQPAVLSQHYDTSTTVIRDALMRLAGERLAVNVPSKGFFVLSLTLQELEDLTRVRVHNDTFALELAIERGDLHWETTVMSAHHVLSRTPRRGPTDPEHTTEAWSQAHKRFHLSLVEGCRIPLLVELTGTMFDSTELYRRWAAPSAAANQRDVAGEHEAILEATLAKDAVAARELLTAHYQRSLKVMLESGLTDPQNLRGSAGP